MILICLLCSPRSAETLSKHFHLSFFLRFAPAIGNIHYYREAFIYSKMFFIKCISSKKTDSLSIFGELKLLAS